MVPFVGFGFMDNLVMIQAGDLIDATIGVKFGLSTLTAAAIGQIFSDVSGVCFGGTMESFALKLGLETPLLTSSQRSLTICRMTRNAGAAFGVTIGCLLGMSSLLFMDLEYAERQKKRKSLDSILQTVMIEGHTLMNAERSSLFLVDTKKKEVWATVATGIEGAETIRMPIGEGIVGFVAQSGEMVNISDAYQDPRFNRAIDKTTGYVTKSVLCAPVKDRDGNVIAVVQIVNKLNGVFDESDEKLCHLICQHISIFMKQVEGK